MGEIQTVTINGRQYDKSTGLPIDVARASRQSLRSSASTKSATRKAPRRVTTSSANIHSTLKSSARIDTRFAKKPLAKRKLAYEKYGAQAEAALERALSRKHAEQQAAKAQTKTVKTESQKVEQSHTVAVPTKNRPEVTQTPAPIKTTEKAYVPAPAPAPSKPISTQKKPSTKLSNPQLESIIKKNRQNSRIDGFTRTATPASQTASIQARRPQGRKNLQPLARPVTPSSHASPNFNIPKQNVNRVVNTESVMPHPIVERAQQVQRQKNSQRAAQPSQAPSSSTLKNSIINETLDKAPKSSHKKLKSRPSKRRMRLVSFASGFAALALFAGYVTYLNVPNISVRVAAAQAGIDASYPGYKPNGYRLSGPVAYSDGEVQMNFVSRQDGSDYTLRESRSSWNSSTLLENHVREASNDNYTVSKEKGITVYHYDGSAAWVSGGILYLLDGDNNLTPEETRRIATSV